MCNCGNKRAGYARLSKNTSTQNIRENIPPKMWSDVNFKYIGKTSLTAVGSITGRHYRFNKPGDVQTIDYRDANAMMAIPVLNKISSSG